MQSHSQLINSDESGSIAFSFEQPESALPILLIDETKSGVAAPKRGSAYPKSRRKPKQLRTIQQWLGYTIYRRRKMLDLSRSQVAERMGNKKLWTDLIKRVEYGQPIDVIHLERLNNALEIPDRHPFALIHKAQKLYEQWQTKCEKSALAVVNGQLHSIETPLDWD